MFKRGIESIAHGMCRSQNSPRLILSGLLIWIFAKPGNTTAHVRARRFGVENRDSMRTSRWHDDPSQIGVYRQYHCSYSRNIPTYGATLLSRLYSRYSPIWDQEIGMKSSSTRGNRYLNLNSTFIVQSIALFTASPLGIEPVGDLSHCTESILPLTEQSLPQQ
jgi:hypothetical protein